MPYRKFSAILSLIVSYIVAIALVALTFFGPILINWYITSRCPTIHEQSLTKLTAVFMWVLYPCIAIGFAAIFCLIKLLLNIIKDNTFLSVNVTYLRIISWCCIGAGLVSCVGAVFYLPFVFAAVAAEFVGLMLHVVKNVMQSAVEIKEDNDLTI